MSHIMTGGRSGNEPYETNHLYTLSLHKPVLDSFDLEGAHYCNSLLAYKYRLGLRGQFGTFLDILIETFS